MSQELVDRLLALAVSPPEAFSAEAHYSESGDCVEFIASPEPFYGERIDSLVTVYYGQQTGDIVGALVKGYRAKIIPWLKQKPGVKIELVDGQLKLGVLFHARQLEAGDKIIAQRYQKLRQVAERTDVCVDMCPV